MQIIGVYFVRELENKLTDNFKDSITSKINFLTYNLEQEFLKERSEDAPTLEEDIQKILAENNSSDDVAEIRVIDKNLKIIGTSDSNNLTIIVQV